MSERRSESDDSWDDRPMFASDADLTVYWPAVRPCYDRAALTTPPAQPDVAPGCDCCGGEHIPGETRAPGETHVVDGSEGECVPRCPHLDHATPPARPDGEASA